jgi:hypothetical protein
MDNGNFIKPANVRGQSHDIKSAAEGATQTFKKGAPLVNSSGYLIAATSEAAVDIVGFAAEDAHNNTAAGDENCQYHPARPGDEWLACVSTTSTQAILFGTYGLKTDATYTNLWEVDLGEGTGNQQSVTITELVDPVGTVNGLVKFELNEYGLHTNGLK